MSIFTAFPPIWPSVNKRPFFHQLLSCECHFSMRTMTAAGRLLAGNIFSRMAALSIVLLCYYREASYAIRGVIIITDVTEAYSMCVCCLLVDSVLSSDPLDA